MHCLELVPLRGEKNFKPSPQDTVLVCLRGSFQHPQGAPPCLFLYGNTPPGGTLQG